MYLVILPFEDVNLSDCHHLAEELRVFLPHISIAPKIEIPSRAYNAFREQYDARELLKQVMKHGNGHALGVTNKDLYEGSLNFIFGMAHIESKAAIISFYRLHEGVDVAGFYERAVKEAMHELGHVFGLTHCDNTQCVMHFSNSLSETDEKSKLYCEKCMQKLPTEIRESILMSQA